GKINTGLVSRDDSGRDFWHVASGEKVCFQLAIVYLDSGLSQRNLLPNYHGIVHFAKTHPDQIDEADSRLSKACLNPQLEEADKNEEQDDGNQQQDAGQQQPKQAGGAYFRAIGRKDRQIHGFLPTGIFKAPISTMMNRYRIALSRSPRLGFSTRRTITLPARTSMQRTHAPCSTRIPSVSTSMRRPSNSTVPAGRRA